MQRIPFAPRPGWEEKLKEIGFGFYDLPASDGTPYWQEKSGYAFSSGEIDLLEDATNALHALCMQFVGDVVSTGDYPTGYQLTPVAKQLIEQSWKKEELSLYGRFDLAYDEDSIKLLEYNADTPTSILEAAVAQWRWKEDHALPDQFNSIHERLIEQWKLIGAKIVGVPSRVHFTGMADAGREDWGTIEYLMDTALQAGLEVKSLVLDQMGWAGEQKMFVDWENEEIVALFKLYAWEWMMKDDLAPYCGESSTTFIEPAWKMLLSNKGLLAELWKRHEGHPLLLPSYYEDQGMAPRSGKWARKPILSREGANVSTVEGGQVKMAPGSEFNPEYDKHGYVLQEWFKLRDYDGFYPIIGSWVVGDGSAGMGIREDTNLVTGNNSHFAPHYFE